MKLFNLTDRLAPGNKHLYPQTLKRPGISIPPGGFIEVPEDFQLGQVAAWVHRNLVSVGNVPHWYATQAMKERRAKVEARNKNFSEESGNPTPRKGRRSKKRNK